MNSNYTKSIISGIIGGATFIIFYLVIHVVIIISIIAALGAFIAMNLILMSPTFYGVSMAGLNESAIEVITKTIEEGSEKVLKIRKLSRNINKLNIRTKTEEICVIADKIFLQLKKNPKGVSYIKKFLNYYLDAMETIISKYQDISSQDINSDEVEGALIKVENFLDRAKKTFIVQQERLVANDIEALKMEVSLFEDTMKSEGIEDEK